MKKILCLCFSPTFQKTITFEKLSLEKVNRSIYYRMDASGKAVNSARVLAQLEKNCVTTFCPLGKNDSEKFTELAKRDEINLSFINIDGGIRECCTLLDKNAGTTTELVVGEPDLQRTKNFIHTEKEMLEKIRLLITQADGVMLAGSRPKVWADDIYSEIAEIAVENQKIFLADFIGNDLTSTLEKCSPSIIKINDEEFCKTFGMDYCDDSEKGISAEKENAPQNHDSEKNENPENDENFTDYELRLKNAIIKKSLELHNIIVVTRGTKSTFAAEKGHFKSCPTEKVKAINTTACGDSFNAGFLHEYLKTKDFESALKKGTWCAARNAENECPGTSKTI